MEKQNTPKRGRPPKADAEKFPICYRVRVNQAQEAHLKANGGPNHLRALIDADMRAKA